MTPANLGKPPQYLKIKESLRSENIIKKISEYYCIAL